MKIGKSPTATKAGRPQRDGSRDVRAALLDAAQQEFVDKGYFGASLRHIASQAGANPAMIHYYFDTKAGLYRAMLENILAPAIERLSDLVEVTEEPCGFAERVLALYADTISGAPWLPALVLRDVLTSDGPARRVFAELVAGRVATLLPEHIVSEQRAGQLRDDLDSRLTTLSLLSLAVFPFIALPIAGPLLGYDLDDASLKRLIEHNTKVFENGTQAKPANELK